MSHADAVAHAFAEQCHSEPTDQCRAAYRHAARVIEALADSLPDLLGIRVTRADTAEPYADAHEQALDLCTNRHIAISDRFCSHNVWEEGTNWKSRVLHDVLGHCPLPGHHEQPVYGFDAAGESRAHTRMLQRLPLLDEVTRRVLFTEFPGQTAYMRTFGDFPPQAGLLLPAGLESYVPNYGPNATTITYMVVER